ncbi:MAG: DUF4347 domain-containing protein, partial [Pirellulaceae bacterium]|nr:DUF4347 domain-containing protein [Pirellulaceae bacterium]
MIRMKARRSRSFQTPRWCFNPLEPRILLAGDAAVAMESTAATFPTADSPAAEFSADQHLSETTQLVFVAPDIADIDRIVDPTLSDSELVLLNADESLIDQISSVLRARANVASVHIITHGDAGRLQLGAELITHESLDRHADQIRGWSASLTKNADVLIYGCNAAAGTEGQKFIARLALLSGADVAASVDVTGNDRRGGDWDLEFSIGAIESSLALNLACQQQFDGILPITIQAAGVTNEEQMLLQIGGTTVAAFDNIGGDAYGGIFETYTFNADGVSADDVRIVFTNDLFDQANGIDRNLRVDKITIDSVDYQTEHPTVYSTGTWLPADGIVAGFRQSEYLHTDGYFQFAELTPNEGSVITIQAYGSEGPENMELRIDGTVVQTWNAVGTTSQTFFYTASDTISPSQVQVAFTNDLWDPANGIDQNLIVDSISIDGQIYQTEDPSVFSTGSWRIEDGIVPGYRESEVLNTNGYFQYSDGTPNTGSQIIVRASGNEGDENMSLQIDGSTVASWTAVGTSAQAFAFTAADTVTADQIRVVFTNDQYNPAAGIDRNLIVDRITVDGVDYETEHPSVYSTGSWLPEDGIVPGFRESEVLNSNGYFQYSSDVTNDPGSLSFVDSVVIVDESTATINLTVQRTDGSDGTVTVDFATVAATATQDEDFVGDSGTLTFVEGETSQSITLTLLPDVIDEADEEFSVVLSNVTGGATLANTTAIITILDDDGPIAPGTLSVSPRVATAGESTPQVSFVVTRSNGSDGVVTVDYATTDATAIAGSDYTFASGTLTFDAGETSKTVDVLILPDSDDESDETFVLTLSNATGGSVLGNDAATGIILDDDQPTLNGSPLFAYQDHLYLLGSATSTWGDAQFEASSLGGNLVTINDAAEEDWLKQTFGSQAFWIGLRENLGTSTYQWVSGEAVTYTNWAAGQPDNQSAQDFAVMNWESTGQWADVRDIYPAIGIIEIGSDVVNGGPVVPNGTGFETELIASGLIQPVAFEEAADGRIFVIEKAGLVRVIENGQLLSTPFLDINEEVNNVRDRGMIGLALDPDFSQNGHVYLQYSVELDPANPDLDDFNTPAGGRLIRVTASAADPNVADPTSRVVIQDGHQSSHATHSVGDIDFDNAGNLIFTWGDGGFDPALRLASQDPASPQGKLFRIDPVTFEGLSGNPYYDSSDPQSIQSRVWAIGVRNSWKIHVDRPTGDIYIGEVTDSGPEEINVMRADGSTILNYGWPYYEDTNRTPYGTVPPNFVYESAFVALPHTDVGGGDAIVGGALHRGSIYPDVYDGRYFFGNFNQGILYTADQSGDFQQFGDTGDYAGAVEIRVGSDGHIWIMSLFDGTINRLVYNGQGGDNTDPAALVAASLTAGSDPLSVTLDASASTDAEGDSLLYAWDFDSDGVIDQTGAVVAHTFTGAGRDVVTLIVSDGRGGSDTRTVEIDVLSTIPADGNVALGRAAIQSATDGRAIASRAVDG